MKIICGKFKFEQLGSEHSERTTKINEKSLSPKEMREKKFKNFPLLYSQSIIRATSCMRMKMENMFSNNLILFFLSFFSFRFYRYFSATLRKTCGGVASCRV